MKKIFIFLTVAISFVCRAENHRGSSAPYISGDGFRAFCKFTFDEVSTQMDFTKVCDGDTVFVKTDYLSRFFRQIHPQIRARYIIVSHNSDASAPGKFKDYLDDPHIIAWFGQNADASHPKFHPIPIGMANRRFSHGNTGAVEEVKKRFSGEERTILLYKNFAEGTFPSERKQVTALFREQPYCVQAARKRFHAYLEDLAHSKFVLSPRGNGWDCHRTWEAILLGAIPIVRSCHLNPLYQGLPILIIEDWREINQEFLERKYEEMKSQSYHLERMYIDYWLKKIHSFQSL